MKALRIFPSISLGAGLVWLAAGGSALAGTIECPTALTTRATDDKGIAWEALGSSWLDQMSLDKTADGQQSVSCLFEIGGEIRTFVKGHCTIEAGDYASIERSDDADIESSVCLPENGRTEECHVTCE